MSGKKKREHRWLALFLTVYHVHPDSLPYETVVGLTANLERMLYRQSLPVLLGSLAADGDSTLPRVWFDALAEHESQIASLEWETNSTRAATRAMRKRGP